MTKNICLNGMIEKLLFDRTISNYARLKQLRVCFFMLFDHQYYGEKYFLNLRYYEKLCLINIINYRL